MMEFTWPEPDWSDIRPDDTLATWLIRTCPDFTWNADGSGNDVIGYLTSNGPYLTPRFSPRLTTSEFHRLFVRRQAQAPIWPGPDNVTLGAPVILTEDAIVAGPMDGILLTVDDIPPSAGKWAVDTFTSIYRGGYVIFISIDGHADVTQFIGPTDNVFVPKGMTTAGSVVIALNRAAQVTVTPWTLGATP